MLEKGISELSNSEKNQVWEDFTFIDDFIWGQEVGIYDGGPTIIYWYVSAKLKV